MGARRGGESGVKKEKNERKRELKREMEGVYIYRERGREDRASGLKGKKTRKGRGSRRGGGWHADQLGKRRGEGG